MLRLNLALHFTLLLLDLALECECLLLKLILLELEKGLLLGGLQKLFLDLLDLVLDVLLVNLDILDVLVDFLLLTIDTILMGLMVITLFSQLLPGRFSLFSHDRSAVELRAHLSDLHFKLGILVRDIGDEADAKVLESALLLELEPLLLELVHRLSHGAFGKEVADEVIDDNGTLYGVGVISLAHCGAQRTLLER